MEDIFHAVGSLLRRILLSPFRASHRLARRWEIGIVLETAIWFGVVGCVLPYLLPNRVALAVFWSAPALAGGCLAVWTLTRRSVQRREREECAWERLCKEGQQESSQRQQSEGQASHPVI